MSQNQSYGRRSRLIAVLLFGLALVFGVVLMKSDLFSRAQASAETSRIRDPEPIDATRALFEAFERYPLVALSEAHGMSEEAEFINSLIRHPEFPSKVGVIVLEACNALHQKLIDQYISGSDDVSLDELRQVWRDHTCAALGPRDSSNIEQFFATVRDVNGQLPPAARIRVLAGDPPIDWSNVTTREDVTPWLAQRDSHYARIVETEVYGKGLRALLIIGGVHLNRGPLPSGDPTGGVMLQFIEQKHPGETFIVTPHEGFGPFNSIWEPKLSQWPRPSLALTENTWLALPPNSGNEDMLQRYANEPPTHARPNSDAILFLGTRDELTMEQLPAGIYDDEQYIHELDRRSQICWGRPLDRSDLTKPRPKKWAEMFPEGDVFIQAK